MRMLNEEVWNEAHSQELLDAWGKGGDDDAICYEDFFQWLFSDGSMIPCVAGAVAPTCGTDVAPKLMQASSPTVAVDPTHPIAAVLVLQPAEDRAAAMAKLLREKPEAASSVDLHGNLPVHLALQTRQPSEVSNLLLQAYAEGAKVRDRFGSLPLHLALSGGSSSSPVVAQLVQIYPEGAGIRDDASGMLPIHLSLMQSELGALPGLVKMLLDAYPDGSIARAPSGDTPIQLAVYLDRGSEVMEEILKAAWKTQWRK